MITDIRNLDDKLNRKFKSILATAMFSLFAAIAGCLIAFLISYEAGYIIALIAIIVGIASISLCIIIKLLGKHLK